LESEPEERLAMYLELRLFRRKLKVMVHTKAIRGGQWLLLTKWKTGWALFLGRHVRVIFRGPKDIMN
jgi:hypothetical protein